MKDISILVYLNQNYYVSKYSLYEKVNVKYEEPKLLCIRHLFVKK